MTDEYDAVVFDNDGVLTHPTREEIVREAVAETLAEFDIDADDEAFEHVYAANPDPVASLASDHGVDPERFWARRERNVAAAQRAELESGAKPLYDDFDALHALREDLGLPLAVVSNNQHETVEHVVDVFDLDGVFQTAYGRDPTLDGLRRKKPEPHYIERALSDLGVEEALYVGDSGVDVLAADAAGLDSAFVRRPHRERYDLPAAPTYEIDGLTDLLDVVA
jgi:HAD superfamily hydrolase (TIGR01549 family)